MKFVRFPVRTLFLAAAALACLGAAARLHACGPWLPEQILTTRQVILRTPVGDFSQEVLALTEADGAPALPPGLARPPAPSRNEHASDSDDENPGHGPSAAEKTELLDALRHYNVPADKWDNLTVAYASFRAELSTRAAHADTSKDKDNDSDSGHRFDQLARAIRQGTPATTASHFVLPATLSEGLPGEWADYLQGAFCFWNSDLAGAKTAWDHLLARPATERLYCSTWAAYMLARIQDDPAAPPAENARRYQRVRQLRAEGCRDLFDLAAASFGWEARLALDHDDCSAAIRLYYLQGISGNQDLDKINSSLDIVASAALGKDEADPDAMARAARDPFLRRVVTLHLACHRIFSDEEDHLIHNPTPTETPAPPPDGHDPARTERSWFEALTRSGVDTVREASSVAWAAYHAADFAQAAAWLAKAPADDGLALWLRAKLALRDGKTDEAAACFAKAVRSYPFEIKPVDNPIDTSDQRVDDGQTFRTQQFHADLGIISLARSDYPQALTALLRSGYWRDAAYVAERVMTPDELRGYVRANFPNQPPPAKPPAKDPIDAAAAEASGSTPLDRLQSQLTLDTTSNPAVYSLRYLLARRLSRLGRYADAREFYPAALWPKFDEYVAALKLGDNAREPKDRRSDALWRAAKIERWLGMEIFGTEDDPDWFVDSGVFDYGDHYREARLQLPPPLDPDANAAPAPTPAPPFVPPVGQDEKRRVARDEVHPPIRYHYRPLASDLAWKAAALMPDQQERTAQVLSAGGLWLSRSGDSGAVDKFYQAILRRCGQTAIGQQAKSLGAIPDVPHEDP